MLIRKILKRKTSRNGKFRYDIICGCLVIKMLSSITVVIDFSNISESQPYQELEQGSTGESEGTGLGHLRLDDDNEFPPMTHKSD